MLEVADVFRHYGDSYFQQFGPRMLPSHRRAFTDILQCRTAAMGAHVYRCDSCGHVQCAYHSCKNRHCPKCQGELTDAFNLLFKGNCTLVTKWVSSPMRRVISK